MEIAIIDPKEYGIEESKALELTTGLNPILENRSALIERFNEIKDLEPTKENVKIFKSLRVEFQKNRTQGINEWHRVSKEVSLRMGQLLDAVKRNENKTNENYESFCEEKEKFLENQEKEAKRLLNEKRLEIIRPFVEDVAGLDFSDFSDENFDDFVLGKKTRYNERIESEKQEALRIENERLAEIEKKRLEEIENERIRIENARLQKEAERKELALQAERKIQAEKEAKIKAENDAKLKAEQEAKAKIEAELQAKKDAEIKAEKERLSKIEAEKKAAALAAKAPIKKQLEIWVNSFELPAFSIENETAKEIHEKFEAFKKWSLTQINNL